ncbi:cysteine--tRNA ligase [Rhizobium sp. RU36D]|uniref:cysteine--tRNA ligase n=1 Tax=Rhizobium sp. RU36D TaxID=1907415 RepID=UPI0009D826AB|nr:cysteine--tRNA ligase [Rhizobium sp. RU36D]SMD07329.1 cysteinyl-tRNA synthetase [Rhizobium sp. RU36D]
MAGGLKLYNTLTREKVDFEPIDATNVRLYVCGPTVYDFAHIGNARPVIVFDVLYRLLRHVYGEAHVTYVRNITDVDDKINARALRDFPDLPLNEAIRAVTEKTESQFHSDVARLGCLKPNVEPRATDNIEQMKEIIIRLIDKGHAYVAAGEVLFDTRSMPDYGQLSKRNLDEQQAGARVAVDAHKKNPGDFVLWKLSSDNEPGWESPWGRGRPGWHIECSAMADRYLWEEIKDSLTPRGKTRPHQFDIHGGGLDLIFPHHENEIAQSCCANGTNVMANVWMHNGFVQVEGRKMSKSDGNFVTINELLATEKFGGPWHGAVLRLAMLSSHYREPIDFTLSGLELALKTLRRWLDAARSLGGYSMSTNGHYLYEIREHFSIGDKVVEALLDDLNTPAAIAAIEDCYKQAKAGSKNAAIELLTTLDTLGFVTPDNIDAISGLLSGDRIAELGSKGIAKLRTLQTLQANKAMVAASSIMSEFEDQGIYVRFEKGGVVSIDGDGSDWLTSQIEARLTMIKNKNWTEADRIRDQLLSKGIQLKDGKDPITGERTTTWELKR